MQGKKRLIKLHRAFSLIVAIVLTVVIAVAIFQKSGLLSYRLTQYVNDHYLKDTPFHFSCGKISGDLVGNVSLSRPVLRYHDKDLVYELFRADRITLDYSLLQVLKMKMIVSNLELEDVRIRIQEDEEGNPIVPRMGVSEDTESSVSPFVDIDRFFIDKMQVALVKRDRTITVKNVGLAGSLRMADGEGEIEIVEGKAFHAESDIPIRSLELKGRFGEQWLAVDKLELRTDASLVIVSGRYEKGRLHHVQAAFNPLDLGEVSALGLIDEDDGSLGGNIVVEGVRDTLSVRGSLTGKAVGLVFSGVSLEGVVTPDEINLTRVEGTLFGSRLNGAATYRRNDGGYSFKGVCESLDISQGFIADREVPETDLNGFISLDYLAPQKAYEITADLRRSMIQGFESDQMKFRLGWRETSGLRIRALSFTGSDFELSGSGIIDAKSNVDMIVGLTGNDVDYVLDYLSLPPVHGQADLAGKIVGPLDRFRLNLNGTWNGITYAFGTIDSSRVYAAARNVGSDDVSATVDIRGRGLDLGGRKFTDPHVLIKAGLAQVRVQDFSFARGDTFITMDFEVEGTEEKSLITLKHLVLRMPHSNWSNEKPTTVVLEGEEARLDTLVLRSIGREVSILGDYAADERTCDVDVWGENIDLALIREVLDLPFQLEGVGAFQGRIQGSIDNPSFDVSLDLVRGMVDSLAFDRLVMDAGFSDRGYFLDDFKIVQGRDSLTASGNWGYMDSPLNVARRGLLHEAAGSAPITVRAKSYGFSLASALKATHQRVYWGGSFDGELSLENTLQHPRFSIEGGLVSRSEDHYRLPRITTEVAYDKGVLSIKNLSFNDGKTAARASGSVHLSLGLGRGPALRDEAPIDITATMSSEDLARVAGYVEALATTGGKASGRLRITGTIGSPRYVGSLEVENGAIRVAGTEESYRDIASRVHLEDSSVRLVSLSGSVGKKGRFSGSGAAELDKFRLKSYEATLRLAEYTLSTIRDFESTQDGELRIVSRPGPAGKPVPMITGKVDVRQAVITKPLGKEEGPPSMLTIPTESPSWLCHIEVSAPKNIWVRNLDLNMELGGDVIMKRDRQGLYLRGDLAVLRGAYTLYNNKFRITEGRIDFSTATTLRPDIHLSAYTPHRVGGAEERRIFLDLSWLSDKKEPTITLSYDAPGYSETDLWKMLGGQVVTGDPTLSTNRAFDAATETAQNLASNYLERILNAQMRDMTVDLESRQLLVGDGNGTNREREMSIAIGRYLSNDLYLQYRQGLNVTTVTEVDVEYHISNMFLLRSEIIKNNGSRGIPGKSRQASDEINFDIRFRFEY